MAKPFLESLGAIPTLAGHRTHRVLVLDGSLSMGYSDGEGTRFERAKTLAAQLIKEARRGDTISLVLMADPPRVVVGDPSPNRDEVHKELKDVVMPHGGTDLAASFAKIDEILAVSPIDQKEIVFLTDLQTASWRRPGGSGEDGLKQAIARIEARKPRSVVIDLGKAGGENRAVVDLKLGAPVVTVGAPVLVRAVVRNFGPLRKDGVRVRLVIDDVLGPEERVDLPVGEDQPVVFNHTFTSPGDHLVEVQLDPDPLKLDDRRRLAVPVREQLNVLLIDGHFKTEAFQAETDYLAQALNPGAVPAGAKSTIHADVVTEGQLARRELARI